MVAETETQAVSVLDFAGKWFLVRVKPQKEERMARELAAQGVQTFLPRERITKTYGTRKRSWNRLAWTGYLFVCGEDAVQNHVWDSLWNIGITRIVDSEKLVNFLHGYETRLADDSPVETRRLYVGKPVLIVHGPLRTAEGRKAVIEKIDGNRVWVTTLILGDIRTMEVESLDCLESVN